MCNFTPADIQDFYVHTLGDEVKPTYQKTAETLQLANDWEGTKSPIPVAAAPAPKPQMTYQHDEPVAAKVFFYLICIIDTSLC